MNLLVRWVVVAAVVGAQVDYESGHDPGKKDPFPTLELMPIVGFFRKRVNEEVSPKITQNVSRALHVSWLEYMSPSGNDRD